MLKLWASIALIFNIKSLINMKKLICYVFALCAISISSCTEDEISVNLDSSGSIVLNIKDSISSLENAKVEVYSNYYDDGRRRTQIVTDGTLNENGSIEFGPLNSRTYGFSIEIPNRGIFNNQFEVVSSNTIERNFDLSEYSSNVEFTINNMPSQSLALEFYMINASIDVDNIEVEEAISKGLRGSLSDNIVTFDNVLEGSYYLYVKKSSDESFTRIVTRYDSFQSAYSIFVDREFDLKREIALPSEIILIDNQWNINRTTLENSNEVTDNIISQISFTSDLCTINFVDGSSYTDDYRAYQNSDNDYMSISLDETYDINENIYRISSIRYLDGDITIRYTDSYYNYDYYEAILK